MIVMQFPNRCAQVAVVRWLRFLALSWLIETGGVGAWDLEFGTWDLEF
jgi:hypothetical protein